MGKKERIQKEIDRLEKYSKFYLNTILAILSGIVWSVYAILENRADLKVVILSAVGVIVVVFLIFKIKFVEIEEDRLLEELEKED